MGTAITPKHRFIVQSRIVGKTTGETPWSKAPVMFDDLYLAMEYRDKFVQWLDGAPGADPVTKTLIALATEILTIDDARFEVRIIKRTIQDEVVDEIERVKNG